MCIMGSVELQNIECIGMCMCSCHSSHINMYGINEIIYPMYLISCNNCYEIIISLSKYYYDTISSVSNLNGKT